MIISRSRPSRVIRSRRDRAAYFRALEFLETRVLLSGNSYVESLYSFTGGGDGSLPFGGLIADSDGNLFGTSVSGGIGNRGAVFELLNGDSRLTILHDFLGNGEGMNPYGTLAMDSAGDLFGVTFEGGAFNRGTVFEIPFGETDPLLLHSFTGADGANPYGGLVLDSKGNIFGTTSSGGSFAHGTIFRISSTGTYTVLHSFNGVTDGATPYAPLVFNGNELWGTTFEGGANDDGTVFKIVGSTFTLVHTFDGTDGAGPTGPLAFDGGGNAFGTTSQGGDNDKGTIFAIVASSTTLTSLYSFTGGNDGSRPFAGMTFDSDGNLFGTTYDGGAFGKGTVFEVPFEDTVPMTIHAFRGFDGANPFAGVLVSPSGNLFGTTQNGGASNRGTMYEFTPTSTTHLTVQTQPSTVTAGAKPTFVIDLKRSNNSNNAGDDSQVTLSVVTGPADAELVGTSTVQAVNGVATFKDLQLTRAGTYTLMASDGSLDPVVLNTIVVNPGAASKVAFVQGPTSIEAGDTLSPSVTVAIEDSLGNVITTANGMITLSLGAGSGTAVLGGTLARAAVNGVATFDDLSMTKSGTFTLSAATPGFAVAKSATFVVTPDFNTAHFAFTQQPGDAVVGKSIVPGVKVSLQDQFGNLILTSSTQVTASLVTISLGGNATAAQLSGTATLKLAKGVASFTNLSINQPGDFQIQVNGGGFPAANTNTLHSVFVPTHLAFTQQPLQQIAGNTFTPSIVISILDAGNRVDTTNNSLVTLTLKGNGTLNGTVTVAAIDGVATFDDLSIEQAGTYTLSATTAGLPAAKSASFKIVPDATTAHLVATTLPPGPVVVGKKLPSIVVQVQDQFGNRITTDHSPVTISMAAGPTNGTLIGTTVVNTSGGVATFKNLLFPVAGSYSLNLTDASLADPTQVGFGQVISQGVTTISGVPAALTKIFGQTVTLSPVFKSNAPTTVPFTGVASIVDNASNVLGTVALTAAGKAAFAVPGLEPGTYASRIIYPGDVNHTAFTSSQFTLQVNMSPTTTSLATSSSSLVFGQPITLTATVKSTTAPGVARTGDVVFLDGITPIGTVTLDGNSMASLTLTPTTLGKHTFKVMYASHAEFLGSTSAAAARTVSRDKTLTTLTPSLASPIVHNQSFNLGVHVSVLAPGASDLTGDLITIKDNGKVLTMLNLDAGGNATLSALNYTSPGTHKLSVIYAGDLETLASTSATLTIKIT